MAIIASIMSGVAGASIILMLALSDYRDHVARCDLVALQEKIYMCTSFNVTIYLIASLCIGLGLGACTYAFWQSFTDLVKTCFKSKNKSS